MEVYYRLVIMQKSNKNICFEVIVAKRRDIIKNSTIKHKKIV